MLKSPFRFFGIATDTTDLHAFEPIYGLPRRSLNEWLSRNPILKQEYEAKLRAYDLRNHR